MKEYGDSVRNQSEEKFPESEITDCLIRILNKASAIERDPVDIGLGIPLYTSEVHLIDLVGRFPGETMTSYASRLGVTRGAISQTVKKLEEKGFLQRSPDENNKKNIRLLLTRMGEEAYSWHTAYHEMVQKNLASGLSGMEPGDQRVLESALRKLELVLDSCNTIRAEHIAKFRFQKKK